MIKIGICEDNRWEREVLRTEIELCLCKHDIRHDLREYESARSMREAGIEFDVIFLDIKMPGMSGIELGQMIRQHDKTVKIIYLTGYAEYVYEAYNVHAFFYLLKPISAAVLEDKLMEALAYIADKNGRKFALKTTIGTVFLESEQIYYFEFSDRKIKVAAECEEYTMRGALHELLKRVKKYGFEMPHQAFVVNLRHVRRISGYKIYLSNGAVIPLAEKKSAAFRTIYNDYLQTIADQI